MAGDLNRATLIGRLGADPEVRSLQNGGRIVSLRLATSEQWRDKSSGERRERTQWHSVVIWNEKLGEIAEQYLRKGSKCLVEGAIETREWEKDGAKRYTTEIVLRSFDAKILLLGSKGDGESGGGNRSSSGSGSAKASAGTSRRQDFDDEIPF